VDAAFSRIELAATELEKITTNNGANDDIKGTAGYLFEDGDLAGILAKMQGSLTARYNLDLDDPDFQNRWTPGSDIVSITSNLLSLEFLN
jgi:hypothetical protein